MSNDKWYCEVQAPPELHEHIEQLFNAISYKIRHADGYIEGYKYGLEKSKDIIFCKNCKYRNLSDICEKFQVKAGDYYLWHHVEDDDFCSKGKRKENNDKG